MTLGAEILERAIAVARLASQARAELGPEAESRVRQRATRNDPALFALVYMSKHLVAPDSGRVTLSEVHVAWAESAKAWSAKSVEPAASRRAEVAPREMGKSTWWFLLLPMWAAAHGHVRFAAAFADTSTQAETHLASFKAELDNNVLLRADYPDLVNPKMRPRGNVAADRVSLYHAKSDFVFAAAGMDSSNLGLKVEDRRPDLIVLDDIEPHEARYSATLATKRLNTLREAILPLNVRAHVIIVGTVTMQGSIVHQIVKRSRGEFDEGDDEPTIWVAEERIVGRHWLPIVNDPGGERRSVWPAKWPLDFLESIEHTRQYAKNYANDPLGADGDYWQIEDFVEAPSEVLDGITHEVISLDPAVTSRESSDYSAIASIGWGRDVGKCVLYEVAALKVGPDEIRLAVLKAAERALERGHAVLVIVETNQGGDLWRRILHGLPFRVKDYSSSAPKAVRAADALDHYQRGRVLHVRKGKGVRDAEGELVAFPRAPNDDRVDAVGAGVRYFLSRKRKTKAGGTVASYA